MMKRSFFAILLCGVLFWLSYSFVSSYFIRPVSGVASLKITTVPSGAKVFLDEKEVGTTPFEGNNLKPAIYTLKISPTTDHRLPITDYQSKLELTASTTTIISRNLGPSEQFSSGFVISYQKVKNSKATPQLTVTSSPNEAQVLIDGRDCGRSPVLQDSLTPGVHKLEVQKDGFVTQSLEFEAKQGHLVNINVALSFDPLTRLTQLSVESLEEKAEEIEIVKRSSWGGGVVEIPEDKLSFAPWQNVKIYQLPNKQSIKAEEWIQGLDFYAQNFLNLPATPFAFLVDEDGKIYEGFGVRDYDFSILDLKPIVPQFVISSGESPTAYLSNKKDLTEAAKNSIARLKSYIRGSLKQAAKLVTVLDAISLEPGKTQKISLEFQNSSEGIWKNSKAEGVILVTLPIERASLVYTTDDWLSASQVTTANETFVLPYKNGKFEFTITAPWYPGDFVEKFGLLDEKTNQVIEGSEIELKIEVTGAGKPIVEIGQTPTGFLNVRDGPSLNNTLIGTVYPGEKYLFLEETSGWYKIKLRDGSEGWVYAKYAEKK